MYLDQIFSKAPHIEINQLSTDSRMPMNNAIFFCIEGVVYDGHKFVEQAIVNGAKVVIYEKDIDTTLNAIFIRVNDVVEVLLKVADAFYGHPANGMDTYVVSGCYGKSMVNYLLREVLLRFEKTGTVGERGIDDGLGYYINPARTLSIIDLFRTLNKMKNNNITSAVFESSVMNLSYRKLDGIKPKAFIYTVTGEESLEFREMNKDYEKSLFEYMSSLPRETQMIINADDILYKDMMLNTSNRYISYGCSDSADLRITSVALSAEHSSFNIIYGNDKYHIESKLVGISSVYNIAAVLAALSLKYPMNQLIEVISEIKPFAGCCQQIDEGQNFHVIIDGASSFQTISRVYSFAKLISKGKKIIAVVPVNYIDNAVKLNDLMYLSQDVCSLIILTSGDTYGKDISDLLNKAEKAVTKTKCVVINDRQSAIEVALDSANSEDIVLLLGKGEENFIYKQNGKVHYDTDEVITRNYLKRMNDTSLDAYFDL